MVKMSRLKFGCLFIVVSFNISKLHISEVAVVPSTRGLNQDKVGLDDITDYKVLLDTELEDIL